MVNKNFLIAVSVLVGTCVGAGILGIPYVAAQSGFFVALFYILFIGAMILTVNLYLGEVSLRTKENHQLPGYAKKYLGKKWGGLMEFGMVFGIYSAIIAYMLGVGESLSFLIFGSSSNTILLSVFFGIFMSVLLWRGLTSLKRFEKIGVAIILLLFVAIFLTFIDKINYQNLLYIHTGNLFLPFGVILFALLSFHAIPEVERILYGNKKLFKKTMVVGTLIPVVLYILFALIVVGHKGMETPEIATLALGSIFVLLGIFTLFTSYLSLGNALQDNLRFDKKFSKKKAWFLTAIVPILIFLLTRVFDYFSFIKILGIGGVVAGGLNGVLILFMIKNAKKKGDRRPEYSMPVSWPIIILISLIFVLGTIYELFF